MSVKLIPLSFNKGYELPTFKENRRGEYWEYGTDRPYRNNYPLFLTKLYNESSKHNTIINTKVSFIVGKGFEIHGNLNFEERARTEAFLRHPNEEDTMIDLLQKLAKDKKVYGGFAVNIRVNELGKIASVDHVDFGNVRKAAEGNRYFYTDNWDGRVPQNNDDWREMEVFPFDDRVLSDKDYIVYYKEYRPDLQVYPLPDYIACVPYLEADAEIANFTLQNIKNNLTSGYVVSFNNGEPTDEEMRNIERRFKDYATGTDNAGKPLLSFTDQNSDHPEITPIPVNGQDERFINLNTQIRQEIYTAHAIVSPMLFGIKDATGLGNNADELRVSAELYQNLHIDPEQMVFNELFNEIVAYNGLPKSLKIQKIEPVQQALSEQAMLGVMTQNEIREKLGLPPLESTHEVGLSSQADDYLFNQLKDYGYREGELEILQTFNNPIHNMQQAEELEKGYLKNFNFDLDRVLTTNEKEVLDLLVKDPDIPVTDLGKALDIRIEEINEIIANLQDVGALDRNFKPTADGLDTWQVPDEEIFVVYKYRKAPNMSGDTIIPGSRDFCRQMIGLGRMYTLNQLRLLKNDFGQTNWDIFTKRGGWYTYPKERNAEGQIIDENQETITRPFCRHIWQQLVVRIKN